MGLRIPRPRSVFQILFDHLHVLPTPLNVLVHVMTQSYLQRYDPYDSKPHICPNFCPISHSARRYCRASISVAHSASLHCFVLAKYVLHLIWVDQHIPDDEPPLRLVYRTFEQISRRPYGSTISACGNRPT